MQPARTVRRRRRRRRGCSPAALPCCRWPSPDRMDTKVDTWRRAAGFRGCRVAASRHGQAGWPAGASQRWALSCASGSRPLPPSPSSPPVFSPTTLTAPMITVLSRDCGQRAQGAKSGDVGLRRPGGGQQRRRSPSECAALAQRPLGAQRRAMSPHAQGRASLSQRTHRALALAQGVEDDRHVEHDGVDARPLAHGRREGG